MARIFRAGGRAGGVSAWAGDGLARWWRVWRRDRDRRRAAMLSAALHLSVLLLVLWALRPQPAEPPPTYLVIDIGTPALAEEVVEAPTAEEPAPQAARPQVEDIEIGEPQVAAAPEPTPATPDLTPQTIQPPGPTPAPAAEAAQAEVADAETAQAEIATAPPLPEPALPAAPPDVPPATVPATPLPEIDVPPLELAPLAQRVPVPAPSVTALVPEVRTIAPTPQATVADVQTVPQPQVRAAVAEAAPVPTPQVATEIAAAAPVPTPQVAADVAAAAPVPMPAVATEVAGPAPVPTPEATTEVVAARPVAQPSVRAEAREGQGVGVEPQVAVAAPRPVPTPQVRADVVAPAPATEAPAVDGARPADATTTAAARELDRPAGGDAPRAGQTGPEPTAAAVGRGAAAGPDGAATPTGTRAPPRPPFTQALERPLAVLVDNAAGYPQHGMRAASQIHEMPVEGGLTRLMLVFDRTDPGRVGPVRSARDYFVDLAHNMDAVLVHDGGSPAALAAIAVGATPTINSFTSGELFSRGDGRAPYNLFSQGDALRAVVNRLQVGRGRVVTGTIYRPGADLLDAAAVRVRYGGTYETGFRYESGINAYRWLRNAEVASDAGGEAVLVDAVLVAAIEAHAIPGDAEGRLYIPLRGGEATLFVRGKAVRGVWELRPGQGVRFATSEGGIDLEPFKTWVIFTPTFERTIIEGP